MAHFCQMPKLTDTMEEGVIVKWVVAVGDAVTPGQQIAEVETDKAVMPLESFDKGTVLALLAPEGKPIPLGDNIYVLGEPGEALPDGAESAKPPVPESASPPAPKTESVGDKGPTADAPPEPPKKKLEPVPPPVAASVPPSGVGKKRLLVSPIAARVAAENGVDLFTLTGTGPEGRIVKKDVEAVLSQKQEKSAVVTKASTLVPISMMRKTVAKRLKAAWQEAPHFFLEREVDATALKALQTTLKQEAPEAHISLNDILIKCCAHALVKVPACNVSFTEEGIVFHEAIHISVAVALEDGLVTPVIRNADQKPLLQIATEIQDLAAKAKDRKLQPQDYTGGTFSISNLGMFGIDKFTAILNPPESLILAVGKVQPKPVVVDGQVVVRDRLVLTLSCDHRAVDGALGAKFLAELAQAIEHPLRMLI